MIATGCHSRQFFVFARLAADVSNLERFWIKWLVAGFEDAGVGHLWQYVAVGDPLCTKQIDFELSFSSLAVIFTLRANIVH